MRIVKEILHPSCKITIFQWNGKYLIKLEQGNIEQTFKVDEIDVNTPAELESIINKKFIDEALKRFREMNESLYKATKDLY
ncbi:MAG: hypothetical protein R3345_00255 [Fulvivirga sp.]|nr:hypothetical protein [Fulvivirga sp.]